MPLQHTPAAMTCDGRPSFWMLAALTCVHRTVSVIDHLAESKRTSLASQGQTAHRVQMRTSSFGLVLAAASNIATPNNSGSSILKVCLGWRGPDAQTADWV
eukprot:4675973-Prymnesium_polylepis.1